MLWIAYRDDISICSLEVDENIVFDSGFAWFSCDNVDFKVPIEDIVEIGNC